MAACGRGIDTSPEKIETRREKLLVILQHRYKTKDAAKIYKLAAGKEGVL